MTTRNKGNAFDNAADFQYFAGESESFDDYYLIIKLSIFESPIILSPTENSLIEMDDWADGFHLSDLKNRKNRSIKIITVDEKCFWIDTNQIEWAITHSDHAAKYPDITNSTFHSTPLLATQTDKAFTLFNMARLGLDASKDNELFFCRDYEWLIKHNSRLITEIPEIIADYKLKFKNYSDMINDTKKINYVDKLLDAWGVRVFLKNGQSTFIKGITQSSKYTLIELTENDSLCPEAVCYLEDEDHNKFMFRRSQIAFIEYPFLMESMLELYEKSIEEPETVTTINSEDVDKTSEKLKSLCWDLSPPKIN